MGKTIHELTHGTVANDTELEGQHTGGGASIRLTALELLTLAAAIYQAKDSDLDALAGLSTAANKVPYFTGAHAAALADFTAAARTLVAAADAAAQRSALGLAAVAASGSASDLATGTLPAARLPAIAITEYLGSVASEAAMLALVGQEGDWCVRSDEGKNYVIIGPDPTDVGDWLALTYPAAAVVSVAGRTGVVVLGTADIGGLGTVATLASDTDTTLAANSDSRVATQKATKAYVDAAGGAGGGVNLGAIIDVPNLPVFL